MLLSLMDRIHNEVYIPMQRILSHAQCAAFTQPCILGPGGVRPVHQRLCSSKPDLQLWVVDRRRLQGQASAGWTSRSLRTYHQRTFRLQFRTEISTSLIIQTLTLQVSWQRCRRQIRVIDFTSSHFGEIGSPAMRLTIRGRFSSLSSCNY